MKAARRPAWYALAPGGRRDYVTLLHPPYTLWHLSYVAIGGAVVQGEAPWQRLVAAGAAFALAMGVGAHALDELNGRPLGTQIGSATLWALAAASIAGACAIGVLSALAWTPGLLVFVAAGAFAVVAYNLELFGGRFHSDRWFALTWGAFPVLTAAFVVAEEVRLEALAAAAFAYLTSRAQRALSTEARAIRRRSPELTDDERYARLRAPEAALRALVWAHAALAVAVVVADYV